MTIISTIGLNAKAADPDNVALIHGDIAPFDGILFPLSRAERVRLMDIDLSTCNKRLNLAAEDNELATTRLNNMQTEVKDLREQAEKKGGFWNDFGMFLLGAGTAVLISYGLHKATQ